MSVERATPSESHWGDMYAGHLFRYLHASEHVAGKRVLDAGCGPGYGSAMMARRGATSVTGIDISSDAVEMAKREWSEPNLRYTVDNCETLENVDDEYDLVVCFENMEHLEHPERFVARAFEKLAPGGRLICSVPDPRSPFSSVVDGVETNPFHMNQFTVESFRALVGGSFPNCSVMHQVLEWNAARRLEAYESLNAHLEYLWSSWPRKIMRKIGTNPKWRSVRALSLPTLRDYSIQSEVECALFGVPHVIIIHAHKDGGS